MFIRRPAPHAFRADFSALPLHCAMGRTAKRVHRDPGSIARLEEIARELPGGRWVRLHCAGSEIEGVVAEQPLVQVFYDESGTEGINAVVRLEDPDVPPFDRYVWLDDIDRVEPLDIARHR
jgi:hypothetical protein